MALTATQIIKIESLLGYPYLYRSIEPSCYNAILAINTSADLQTYIEGIITQIDAIETQITNSLPAAMALKSEETETDFHMHIEQLRKQGRILIGRIASAIDINIKNDYFGQSVAQKIGSKTIFK